MLINKPAGIMSAVLLMFAKPELRQISYAD